MILYSQAGCPQCRMIHMLLDKANINYEECDNIEEMKKQNIDHTPVLMLDDGSILKGKEIFTWINSH